MKRTVRISITHTHTHTPYNTIKLTLSMNINSGNRKYTEEEKLIFIKFLFKASE